MDRLLNSKQQQKDDHLPTKAVNIVVHVSVAVIPIILLFIRCGVILGQWCCRGKRESKVCENDGCSFYHASNKFNTQTVTIALLEARPMSSLAAFCLFLAFSAATSWKVFFPLCFLVLGTPIVTVEVELEAETSWNNEFSTECIRWGAQLQASHAFLPSLHIILYNYVIQIWAQPSCVKVCLFSQRNRTLCLRKHCIATRLLRWYLIFEFV